MKRLFYLISFSLFIITASQAQYIRCGTAELHKMKMQSDPQYRVYYENIEEKMKDWASLGAQQRIAGAGPIVIPVVVHVLWNTSAQNISDAQIQSQMKVLNEDFSGKNADTSQIPADFKSVFGKANIYFCLASRKSNGDWTTGIERRQTSVTSFPFRDSRIKDYASGGLDAWDRSQYLNIWVTNLSGGLLGYTEMPGSNALVDGCVIQYNAFGRGVGSLQSSFNKGRTSTHEIGHWLGLWHTWGDDNGSCSGSDYVGDTPNQANYTYGCPSFPVKDACSPNSPGVMFVNFLDYSDDRCMHMFTAGQAAVMQGVLNNYRPGLLTSNGCGAATGFADNNVQTFIDAYPNPASDLIHIYIHLPAVTVLNITAYDMLGKLLTRSEVHRAGEQNINLDVSSLKSGLYSLVVSTSQGNIAKRFSIAR